MDVGDGLISLLQPGFQIFFCRLLRVKTGCFVIWLVAGAVFALGGNRSPSALSIHSVVSGFIEGDPTLHNFSQKRVAPVQTLRQVLRRVNHQIKTKTVGDCPANYRRLLKLRPLGIHDDQQIDVAFGAECSVGVGTEQYDFLGVEKNRNLLRQAVNGGLGDSSSIGNSRNTDQ